MNSFSTKCVRAFLNSLAITALLSGVAVAQDSKDPDQAKTQDTAKQDAAKQEDRRIQSCER
jgi:hypothetical protein